jgi:hypothetical protein
MALTNNLVKQVDLPVWEWMRFAPVATGTLTCLTTARDGSDRYLYYYASNILYRYDTWGDSWQQLSTNSTPVGALNVKHVKNQGFRGQVISVPATNKLQIPSTCGNNVVGMVIKIVSGPGAGQERTITAIAEEVIHDQGLVTTATANVLTDTVKRWKFNQWEGYTAKLIFNTGFSQYREVIYNDTTSVTVFDANYDARNFLMAPFSSTAPYATPNATAGTQAHFTITSQVLTIDSPWTVTPTVDSKFVIYSGGIWWISQNSVSPFFTYVYHDLLSDRFVTKLTPAGIFGAAIAQDWAIAPLSENLAGSILSSSLTSATSMSVTDTSLNMTPGAYAGYRLELTTGSANGDSRRITANTNNTFTLNRAWTTIPSASNAYKITAEENVYFEGNARAQMLKYHPEQSLWASSNIVDSGTTFQMALLRGSGSLGHGVTTATRVANGIATIGITASGSGYTLGDLVTVGGGTLGRAYIEAINAVGSVLSASVYTVGSGYTAGTQTTTGGSGTGLTINVLTTTPSVGVVTTSINHDFLIGDQVRFAGDSGSANGATASLWNGNYTISGIQSATVVEIPLTASLTTAAVPRYTLATSLLVDVSKNWKPNEHSGKLIGVQSNGLAGTVTWRRIMGNSENTIAFLAGVAPTNGNSRYFIQELESFGRDVAYLADNQLPYGYSTAGSTTGSIIDNTKNWIPGAYNNHKVKIIDTQGNTVEDIITINTTSSLSVGRIVAAINGGGNTLAYSNDGGLTWTGLGTSIFGTAATVVCWNGTRFVAGGSGTNGLAWSNDGITWNGLGTAIFNLNPNVIINNGVRFVAGAPGGTTNTLAWSNDGVTWNGLGTTTFSGGGCSGIVWTGTRFIAGGNGTTNTLAYSTDGITWTGLGNSVFSSNCNKIAWNGSRLVAVGSGGNTLAYSDDGGFTWTGLGTSIFSIVGQSVLWNGTRWVAGGASNNRLAWSNDGITWTGLGDIIFTNTFTIMWDGTKFIAGGNGTNSIAYSTDGITWTAGGIPLGANFNGLASTAHFVSLTPNIGVVPSTGSYYQIHDSYGSVTAGSVTTLTDNNKRWKVNQWAGKRLVVTSGTGIQQELAIASNTATQLTFATATAPDTTSTYTILGRPAVGAGIGLEWNWGTSDSGSKAKYLISPRGGGSHTFDIYDLSTTRWKYGQYIIGQGETLTAGSMYAYDGGDRLYFVKSDTSGRLFYYDLIKNSIEAFGQVPYGMGTLTLGNRLEIVKTADGLKYIYVMRHTGTEMWRTIISF